MIILDAGHGGKDSGIVAPNGTKEKTQALSLVLTIKHILQTEFGLADEQIGLTRTKDSYPSLDSRIAKANESKAKLFVSVHFDIPQAGWRWGTYHAGNFASEKLAKRVSNALDEINGTVGTWTRSHVESRFGRLYIANFREVAILVEFGPIRNCGKDERLRLARAVAPVLVEHLKESNHD